MAKRGPKPSPREALELRGSRHIKQDEYNERLEPPAWTPPAPPDHFDENARIFWLYYAPLFIDYGVLNALTCPAFELMCSEYGRFCVAAAKERSQGSVQETPNGYEAPTTWHSIAVKSQERLLKLFAAFGMMPHQRAIGELSDDLIGQL